MEQKSKSVWRPVYNKGKLFKRGLNPVYIHSLIKTENNIPVITLCHVDSVGDPKEPTNDTAYIVKYFHPITRAYDFDSKGFVEDVSHPSFQRELRREIQILEEIASSLFITFTACYPPAEDTKEIYNFASAFLYTLRGYSEYGHRFKELTPKLVSQLVKLFFDYAGDLLSIADNRIEGGRKALSFYAYLDEYYSKSFSKKYNGQLFMCPPFNPSHAPSFIPNLEKRAPKSDFWKPRIEKGYIIKSDRCIFGAISRKRFNGSGGLEKKEDSGEKQEVPF